jgi:TonB family protein
MKNYLLITAILLLPILLKAQAPVDATKSTASTEKPTSAIIQPSFPDGVEALNHFLSHNIRYPKIARENGVQGQVLVEFVVEEDGSLTNFSIVSSPSDDLSKESLRVLALLPKWKPGTKDGKPVRVKFTYPINFTLGGGIAIPGFRGN